MRCNGSFCYAYYTVFNEGFIGSDWIGGNVTMSYYEILGVNPNANSEEIKRKYRVLALAYHPDKNPEGEEQFKAITTAYKTLSDQHERTRYDLSFTQGQTKRPTPTSPNSSGTSTSSSFSSAPTFRRQSPLSHLSGTTGSSASSRSTTPEPDKPQVCAALELIDKAIYEYNAGSKGSDSEVLKKNIRTVLTRLAENEKTENAEGKLRAIKNALSLNPNATKLLGKLKQHGITVDSLNETLSGFDIFEKIKSTIRSIGIESSPSFFAAGFYKDSRKAQFEILQIINSTAKKENKLEAIQAVLKNSPNATRLIGGLKERGITPGVLNIHIDYCSSSKKSYAPT